MLVRCAYSSCGKLHEHRACDVKRAKDKDLNLYCDRKCSGLGRRKNISIEDKRLIKKEYDKKYRDLNVEMLRKKKSEYNARTYDPVKAAIIRKKRMHLHIKYCQQPWYKKWKKKYDEKYKAKQKYGEFSEAAILNKYLMKEVDNRAAKQQNDLINKTQKRKRLCKQTRRGAQRR